MRALTKITFLNDEGEKFFGEGPCRLLRMVEETGSLHSAAVAMGMAYTKAMKIMKNAEKSLGFALTTRAIGGKNGGGSQLTAEGRAWLERYEAYRDACVRANLSLYREYFPKLGCVIMASGLGKRFGSNKLMADFGGVPMICRALNATQGLFSRRVVVTRHADVAELCRNQDVEVVLHDLPLRSDVVRLGLEALKDVDGCLFCPGDQPLLERDTVNSLLRSWEADRDFIWRVSCDGVPGMPVLFPKWAFEALMHLPEGRGGSYLLEQYPDRVRMMNIEKNWEISDADTPEALKRLLNIYEEMRGGL